jgi:protein TonB
MDVMKMKAMRKPLQLSFIFHVIIFLALVTLNMTQVRSQNILVVDFSMENEPYMHEGSNTATVSLPVKLKKNQKNRHVTEPLQNQHNEARELTVTPESSDTQVLSQTDPQTPIVPVSQTNLGTQMGLSEFARYGSQSIIYEAGFQKGVPSVPSLAGKGDIGSSEKSRYLKAHFSYIKDLIHKNLIYPAMAKKMGWEGKVIVSFIISSGGNARDIMLSKSSGHEILDDNALKAVRIAAPFPKPPVEAQIIVPVLYRLN